MSGRRILYMTAPNDFCSANGAYEFEKGSWISWGDEQALLSIYKAAVKTNLVTGKFTSLFFLTFNKRAMNMFRLVKFVALKNYPISCVLDDDLRDFSETNVPICIQSFKETMFKLLGIFEAKIQVEMQQSRGAIMYDGWTSSSMH